MKNLLGKRTEISIRIEKASAELREANSAAKAERSVLALQEQLGEIDHDKAVDRRREIGANLDRLRQKLRVLKEAGPALDERILDEDEKRRLTRLLTRRKELEQAISTRRGAEAALRRALVSAETAAAELERHRTLVARAVSAVDQERLEAEPKAWPEDADERWHGDGLDSLQTLLEEGPFEPNAKLAAGLADVQATRDAQDEELLAWVSQWPLDERIAQLPERLREQGRAIAREYDAELAKTRRKREAARSTAAAA